jgi:uncharacterized repeat protein (TIGR01451 family)
MQRMLVVLGMLMLAASASGYVVNNDGDAVDVNPGDNVCATSDNVCTLRAAIMEANATSGLQPIAFSIAGPIEPDSILPAIVDPVNIDATTAPGYAGAPVVILDGAPGGLNLGMDFSGGGADGSSLAGMQFQGFNFSALIVSSSTTTIRRNYLGVSGAANADGLQLSGTGNVIGGAPGEGNVISGNTGYGIRAEGNGHTISDNRIGVDPSATAALGNGLAGVYLFNGATNVVVERNIISGNGGDGVFVEQSSSITIRANAIGTDISGTVGLGNGAAGVRVSASSGVTIGGTTASARNVIAGNTAAGVYFESGSENLVIGNFIGVDATGAAVLPNNEGVLLTSDAPDNTIGAAGAGNVISGNNSHGVDAGGANDTKVRANLIGLDATGSVTLPNGLSGVQVTNATNADVGGLLAGEGNVIAGHGSGIYFSVVDDSRILGNIIGLDAAGTTAQPNIIGVQLDGTTNVTAGSNTISGNIVGLIAFFSDADIIENNRVGTNPAGDAAIGNLGTGILILDSIDVVVRGNVVGGNGEHGIELTDGSIGTIVHSNFVGISADLSVPLPNALDGVNVCDGAEDTVVGSVLLGGNVIAHNEENGIGVEPTALLNNTWAANSIFDNTLLGIDLAIDGVTPNDPLDEDTGPNDLQNFPTLTLALTTPTTSHVRGTMHTTPNTAVALHFYSSLAADPSGFGEGQTYLGTTNVTTDASGDAPFTFDGAALTVGHVVTATATSASGTSEFSEAVEVEPAPTVQFSSATFASGESGGPASITVIRTGDLSVTSTVQYATSNNTATAGADYTSVSGTLTFNPTESTVTFTVPILDDVTDESDELVNLTLSNPTMATLGTPSAAQLTITDDDAAPSIIINDVGLAEGNAGPTSFVFTIALSAPSAFAVQVDYATADNSAFAGADYTATNGTAIIAAGNTSTTITVQVTGDVTLEPDETFFVNLTNPVNATISDAQGTGTIQNDEGVPTLSIDDRTLAEGNAGPTSFTFTVTASGTSATPIAFQYATADGTAAAGTDYAATSDSGTIAPNTTSTTITVLVNGDLLVEPDETFFVNLSAPSGASIARSQGVGTIANDEGVPTLAIDNRTLAEGNAGTTDFVFTVTLSAPSATPVTFLWATADDTAAAGSDYAANSGSGTIAPGTTSTTITIAANGDTTFEPDETFFVNLSAPSGAAIADGQGLGTIANDDTAPTANLGITKTASSATFTPGQTITFTITVTNAGPAAATGVTVTDILPAGTTFQSVSSPGATCTGTSTVTCSIPTLASGGSVVITLAVTATGASAISNTATVAPVDTDPVPANNSSTAIIGPAVAGIPTLSTWMLILLAALLTVVAVRRF